MPRVRPGREGGRLNQVVLILLSPTTRLPDSKRRVAYRELVTPKIGGFAVPHDGTFAYARLRHRLEMDQGRAGLSLTGTLRLGSGCVCNCFLRLSSESDGIY